MNYSQVKNPVWANAQHTVINCDVDFDDLSEEFVPFTANPLDTSNPASKEIFDACVAGEYGQIAEYVPPPPYIPSAETNKQTATQLLYETDWTTIPDVADPALSNPYLMNQADFFAYRSALRQIAVYPTAGNINFPTKPQEQWSS
jgi:hypothetical protein